MEDQQATIRNCLEEVRRTYLELETGQRSTVVDASVDFTTAADTLISETIAEYFRELRTDYRLLSEESAATSGEAGQTVIVDEIDGTANMINGSDAPFGPVVAIAPTDDPRFRDIEAMGFLALNSGDLYEAYKDDGAFVTSDWARDIEETTRLSTAATGGLSGDEFPQVLVDQYMLSDRAEIAEALWNLGYPGDFRSTAYHVSLVARGSYDAAVTGDYCALNQNKRATAEELAGGYLLVTEAGGTVTTWSGEDIGDKRVGLDDGETFDSIVASNEKMAQRISRAIADHLGSQ
jgi:fructose-1,6-bisphosphatase/inositol monophosphatase family enzyme